MFEMLLKIQFFIVIKIDLDVIQNGDFIYLYVKLKVDFKNIII